MVLERFCWNAWRCSVFLLSGMLMDLVSLLFASFFVFVVCLGCLSRSFTGDASGATRAALTQHFSLANNAADISAKEGSQETLATMIGMLLGMLLAHITMGNSYAIWISFLPLPCFIFMQFITTRQDKYILLENQGHVKIIIHNSATSTDILQSYVHALVLSRIVAKTTTFHVEIHIWMDKNYEGFMRKLQSLGWNTECPLCSSIVWRANWLYNSADEKSNQVNHRKLEKRRDLRKGWL